MTYKQSMYFLKQNRNDINLAELAEKTGLAEKYLTFCIDGIIREGRPVVVSRGLREKFIQAVQDLNFNNI